MANLKPNTVVTGMDTKLSYCYIYEKTSINGGAEKYSCSVLIPKDDKVTLDAIKKAIDYVIKNNDKFSAKERSTLNLPLHDGDQKGDESYAGYYYLNAKSDVKPTLFDQNAKVVTDTETFYSGCYARVILLFYAYSKGGNKGIGVGLGDMQKVRDGKNLTGKVSGMSAFTSLGGSDEETEDFLS